MASYIKNNVLYYYLEELYEGNPVRYEVPAVLNGDGTINESDSEENLNAVKPQFQQMFEMDKLYPQT